MKLVQWFHPPRVVLTLFIGLMTTCALALGWLGWQVVVQDRAVEAQRRQEQLESVADLAVVAMEHAFAASDAEVMVKATGEVEITPAERLAYAPTENKAAPIHAEIFDEAESLEFGKHDRVKAAEVYARLAESSSAQIRADALVRLGRVLRREQKWAQALQAYDSLQRLDGVAVVGMPAGLVARAARCSVLEESGDGIAAESQATALWADLVAGKWNVTKAILETYLNELRFVAPEARLPGDWEERMTLADAARWAFEQQSTTGRIARISDGQVAWVSWKRQDGAWKARLIGPSFWQALWRKLENDRGIALRVVDAEGHVIHGVGPTTGQAAFRAAATSGLPWSITATSLADVAPSGYWSARRRFLITGLAIFAGVLSLGSFLIARGISRDFAVARLQSDFVAAVSHEFRTPLTSIRQLSEMLARDRVETEQDRHRAYELMLGQSDRLGRLVESLLDFGRMQAREFKFRSETLEAAQLFGSVAKEFQETVQSRGYAIEFTGPEYDAWIRGDREALGGALWNFLDNAVKYSPHEKQVLVAVSRSNGNVEVSVRDRGFGIAKEDLKRVFGRFYRGANAKAQGTQGTGIGLAIVKEIVEGHGGTVRVHSEPGEGSEFTMVLPCRES